MSPQRPGDGAPIEPLKACPRCGYDLTGLPEVHTCPECGLEYDPHCRVMRSDVRRFEYKQLLFGGALLAMIAIVAIAYGVPHVDAWLLTVIGVGMLASIWRLARGAGRSYELTINRRGVQFDHPGLPDRVIAWDEIGEAGYSWVRGRFYLRARDGTMLFTCGRMRLGGAREARRCADAIYWLKRVYADCTPPNSGGT